MSLRDELVASIEAVADADKRTTDSAAYDLAYSRSFDFLRDHGQALIEAVADAERYRWLRDNDDPSGEVPYITRQVCNSWGNWVDDVELTGAAIDTAIDLARTKASAGVGA